MNIRQNHFELFGLPVRYALDAKQLDAAYRDLQSQVHPDRFVASGGAEKRVALQWATHANEAYETLRNPLKRAAYLCELRGVAVESGPNTTMPADFLMLQIDTRETLAEAREQGDVAALERLQEDNCAMQRGLIENIGQQIDQHNDTHAAAASVRRLMFLEKLGDDIALAYESIEV